MKGNVHEEFSDRFEEAEERTRELEERIIEIIESGCRKKKIRYKKSKQSLRNCGTSKAN